MREITLLHISYLSYMKLVCACVRVYVKVKVKVNFTLEQATKAQRGSGGIALLFP